MERSKFNIQSAENGMCAHPVMAVTIEGTSRSVAKNKKTRAEIQREYRKRKAQAKKLKESNELSENKKVKKTKAEIQKEYRKRKALAKKLKESNGLSEGKKVKKTKAEIQREYRKRKAEAKKLLKSKDLPECKKTRAEIQREYRKRKKIERLVKERKISLEEDLSAELPKKPKLCDLALANAEFKKRFICNPFGFACNICDRLWFEKDLKGVGLKCYDLLSTEFPDEDITTFKLCVSCQLSLFAGRIPTLSRTHGFIYPKYPNHLPPLNCLEEKLISPVIPFRQIRRTRRITDSKKILGQVINVPVDESTKVHSLPRELEGDYTMNVHIKRMQIYKSSQLQEFIKKGTIKQWLEYLSDQPLYRNIVINKEFFSCEKDQVKDEGIIENLNPENDSEVLMAQQHSLMWSEDKYLSLALGEKNTPLNIICDEFVEELSFPSIYLGQARMFTCDVTAFQVATSEIRRRDRRGVTPEHILYLAMKIMRLRIIQGVKDTLKAVGDASAITRKMIEDKQFIEQCVELNISFLQTIPNSVQCWVQRKKDLFAMIRQLGKPTAFLTLSSSEYKWSQLLKILYKLKYGREFEGDPMELMSAVERCTLVNEDPVCCVLHFDKLVDTILCILQSSTCSPFGKYRVVNFFKCIEFSHRGSVHARILLWLENDPKEAISENMPETIKLINELCTVNTDQLKTSRQNQTHHHTFACYKKNNKCMFEAPFWPINETRILIPLSKDDGRREQYRKKYVDLKFELEIEEDYSSLNEFLLRNNIEDYDEYLNIIRAGIHQPVVMLKRSIKEKWICNFNPWVASILNSNMDLQFILDEYSCAAYIVEYVNKTKRGISELHHQLNTIRVEYPDKDYADLLMQVGVQMLNSIEMSSQEAAWYLLRLGMSESSCKVEYIPTIMPYYRQRVKKKTKDIIDEDSSNIWKEGTIEKYEKRPEELNEVSLAEFVSLYNKTSIGTYKMRKDPKIIHWKNYDMIEDMDNYKREMVTLFHPFRNEMLEIIDNDQYLEIFDKYELRILEVKKKFHSDVNIEKIMEECERLCIEKEQEEEKKDQFLKIRLLQEETV